MADAMVVGAELDDVQPGLDQQLDAEVREQLDAWARRWDGSPRAQRRALLLFGLEREQIVTVAYREDVLADRIDQLAADDELRQLIRRALAWVWRDEALHVEWVRGQLRHEHRPVPALVLLGHQLTGLVGGWITTTRMHPKAGRWAADQVARALVLGARLTRRISPDLARELRGQTFGRYAALNVALERTAERSWLRLAELATDDAERAELRRIAEDEANHRRVFAAIAALFDDHDRLRPDATAALLAARLAEVSPWFLPSAERGVAHVPAGVRARSGARALGSGAPVHVADDANGRGVREALRQVVEATGVLDQVRPGDTATIRTCFMVGYDRADRSNVADVQALEELAMALRARGAIDVVVLEQPTIYDRYVSGRSVNEVARYFGFESPAYRVVDAEADQVPCAYPRGLGRRTISRSWLVADHRIVLAKATTDPVEYGHLSLCALEGTGGRVDQTVYFGRYTDFRSATMMVLDLAPPDLAIVDAWGPVADGPVGVMGSHRPCHPRRLYAGADALAVDLAVLADMGAPQPTRRPMMAAAAQWLGIDLAAPQVHGPTGRWGGGFRGPDATAWNRLVCRLAMPMYTYGGAQGARFVPRFDGEAFADLGPVRLDIRASRWLAQRVFGLHPPKP